MFLRATVWILFLTFLFSSQVFDKLQGIHNMVRRTNSSPHPLPPSQSFPRPPNSLDTSVGGLSNQLSKLGPLEDMYQPSQSSFSSLCSITPHPLHSSSSSLPTTSSSFAGPCETDESRGFSQYDLRSQFRANASSSRSLSPSIRDQHHCTTGPTESQFSQPSVPTEDQYSFTPQSRDRPGAGVLVGASTGPDTSGQNTGSIPECLSPAGSLQLPSPGPSGRSIDHERTRPCNVMYSLISDPLETQSSILRPADDSDLKVILS